MKENTKERISTFVDIIFCTIHNLVRWVVSAAITIGLAFCIIRVTIGVVNIERNANAICKEAHVNGAGCDTYTIMNILEWLK